MMRLARTAGLIFLLLMLAVVSGCLTITGGKPPGPWYEAYEPIEDAASEQFVADALAHAVERYGEPVIPVRKVLLRRSRKTGEARRYRIGEDFSLTECADSTNGVFVIYIAVDPDHPNYYALLGHECAHLLNPHITDWYMEGFATDFSERICARSGKKWGTWKRHFMKSRRDPYALSYRMMVQLREAMPEAYARLPGYTAANTKRQGWLRIDIDRWLAARSDDRFNEALGIIEPYAEQLAEQVSLQYDFAVPAALK